MKIISTLLGMQFRATVIVREVRSLWQKESNFPMLSSPGVQEKLDQVLNPYNNCVKWAKYDALKFFTPRKKLAGAWLCSENRLLCHLQFKAIWRKCWIYNWEGCKLQKYSFIQKKKSKLGTIFNINNNITSKTICNFNASYIANSFWKIIFFKKKITIMFYIVCVRLKDFW